jgi:uncharacterized delta-60 repeat protein
LIQHRSTLLKLAVVAQLWATTAFAQQPFELDPTFRTTITRDYVNSIALMEDGRILVSGEINFANGDWRPLTRLNSDGSRDVTYPVQWAGGGKLVSWNDRYYVNLGGFIGKPDRLLPDGFVDPSFDIGQNDAYVNTVQGGDYHVYPDGSVVIGGSHVINYPDSGWASTDYCMIWFNNDGSLDVTREPRRCNGSVDKIVPLPNGKFLIGASGNSWDQQPVANIFRVHADGTLDTTFHSAVAWGVPASITVLDDERILISGLLKTQAASTDTLHMVRLMQDGEFDPSFNNELGLMAVPWTAPLWPNTPINWGQRAFPQHTVLSDGRIVLHGYHYIIEGEQRLGMAMLDADGYLLEEPFSEGGCGRYLNIGWLYGNINGILEAPDGYIYIWGAYHGYDDGTTNDPSQRFISRLYGLSVGVQEREIQQLQMHPNPTRTAVTIALPEGMRNAEVIVHDALGRVMHQQRIAVADGFSFGVTGWPGGLYQVQVLSDGVRKAAGKVVVE